MKTTKWYRYIGADVIGVAIVAPFVYLMNGFWVGSICLAATILLLILVHFIVWKCT